MTITGTPIVATEAAYLTVVEADAMALNRPNSAAWTGTGKAAALAEATRHIDALPSLRGQKYDLTYTGSVANQALEFPRVIDGETVGDAAGNAVVPDLVKRACLEEAIAIMEWGASWRRKNQEQGVTQVQLGSGSGLSESYRLPESMLSFRAKQLMRRYMGANIR